MQEKMPKNKYMGISLNGMKNVKNRHQTKKSDTLKEAEYPTV